jgi:transmembrane sensor
VPTAYRTAHGEQNAWRLADGSIMRLNTDSAVTVRYSRRERLVEVERGQVLFETAHGERRRFRVAAGEAGAIAVGTRFEVYRKPASTVVTVAEGRVAVFTGEPPRWSNPDISVPQALYVEAGYQARIDAGVLSAHAVAVDLHQALAWLRRRIEFENRPLGEIADEYNRYAGVPLEIDDPALRALRVSGAFDTADPASFVAFVATLDGVRVETTPTRVRVLR